MLGTAQSATTPKYGKCKPTGKYDSLKLKTVKADILTVGYVHDLAADLRRATRPASVNDGYNYCFAANIAYRAGSRRSKLTKSTSRSSSSAASRGFDVAIDDIYIKPEREAKVDFSIPYGHSWTGLVRPHGRARSTKAG